MNPNLASSMIAAVVHGGATPILWIVGIILIVAGVISIFRGSLIFGVVLIIVGVVLGGLNVL